MTDHDAKAGAPEAVRLRRWLLAGIIVSLSAAPAAAQRDAVIANPNCREVTPWHYECGPSPGEQALQAVDDLAKKVSDLAARVKALEAERNRP
jgi:hypothetical protein